MKETLNKIKIVLSSLWITIISFPFKVMGLLESSVSNLSNSQIEKFQTDYGVLSPEITSQRGKKINIEAPMQGLYGVPSPSDPAPITAIKIAQIGLTAIIFIVGIINFIKIRKIDDKFLKKKKIKRTIVILLAILFVILLMSIAIRLLEKYNI